MGHLRSSRLSLVMSAKHPRQLFWCMDELENRSNLFAAGIQTRSVEHLMYWGYLLGRISQLLKNFHIQKYWTDRVSSMTLSKVVWFLRGKLTDNPKVLINFGFGVGFCQEFFGENAEKWWNPLIPHLMNKSVDLEEVQMITLENLPKLENLHLFQIDSVVDPHLSLDWMQIATELQEEHSGIRILVRWEEVKNIPQKLVTAKL